MRQLLTRIKTSFSSPSQPQLLYRSFSKESGQIEVWQKGYEKQLVVGGLVQSVSADTPTAGQRVWGRIAKLIIDSLVDPRSCLLLGLGGGTVAHLLDRHFPHLKITAVEIDPVIISIGKTYFELRQLTNLKIIQADAFDILNKPLWFVSPYDVIVVDLYKGEVFPDKFASSEFVSFIGENLSPQGIIVFNRVFSPDLQERLGGFEQLLRVYFFRVERVAVTGVAGGENILFTAGDYKASAQNYV